VGWALAATAIVSAATISTGFAGYLQSFIDLPHEVVVTVLVLAVGAVAAKGMNESAWFMASTTLVGMGALLLVFVAAGPEMLDVIPVTAGAIASADAAALTGLFAGAMLAFYSFIGFGDMAMTAEEVRNVRTTMPRAIALALTLVTAFYLLTIAVALGVLAADDLAASKAPLVAVVRARGWAGWEVGLPSLFIIVNGALTQTITAARLLLHMGREEAGAPAWMGAVHPRTQTPLRATGGVMVVVLLLALLVPLKTLASITSLLILLVFASVHASLIVLKRREQPVGVPRIPAWVPYTGACLCLLAVAGQGARVLGNL
jgi:amino acid transporter